MTILMTNHAQPRQPISTELVHLELTSGSAPRAVHLERIDDSHANAHGRWIEMGAPSYLWLSIYAWKKIYDYDLIYAGPLFIHQLSHVWIDFRGIQDAFTRARQIDYFENSRRATYVQREYAIRNPLEFAGYSQDCRGVTASDGPGATLGPDDGTVAPWGVVASLPFAPEIDMPAIRYFVDVRLEQDEAYGFKASFNPTYPPTAEGAPGWVSPWNFGLNQGPIVFMIENHRTGLIWRLMRQCPYVVNGLRRAGFNGGWL